MATIIIKNNFEEFSADTIIEIINPKKKDLFNNFIENNVIEKDDENYRNFEFSNTRIPIYMSMPTKGNYKYVAHILIDDELEYKLGDFLKAYYTIFHYMMCVGAKMIVLSLDQFMNLKFRTRMEAFIFSSRMASDSANFDLDIGMVVESDKLKEELYESIEKYDEECPGEIERYKQTIILKDDCFEKCADNYQFFVQLNDYMKDNAYKISFRKILSEYIMKSGLSESNIAKLSYMNRGTLTSIKNGCRDITKSVALSLGIALGVGAEKFSEFIEMAGFLFPETNDKDDEMRDLIILHLLENDITRDIHVINCILDEYNLELLGETMSDIDIKGE